MCCALFKHLVGNKKISIKFSVYITKTNVLKLLFFNVIMKVAVQSFCLRRGDILKKKKFSLQFFIQFTHYQEIMCDVIKSANKMCSIQITQHCFSRKWTWDYLYGCFGMQWVSSCRMDKNAYRCVQSSWTWEHYKQLFWRVRFTKIREKPANSQTFFCAQPYLAVLTLLFKH